MYRPRPSLYTTLLIAAVPNLGDAASGTTELYRDCHSCTVRDVPVERAQVGVRGDWKAEALVAHREVDDMIRADSRGRYACVYRLGRIVRGIDVANFGGGKTAIVVSIHRDFNLRTHARQSVVPIF
jgi:hypothetical protein